METTLTSATRYLRLPEAARRVQMSPTTLRKWVASGKLNGSNGLRRVGSSWLIDWPLFEAKFIERDGF